MRGESRGVLRWEEPPDPLLLLLCHHSRSVGVGWSAVQRWEGKWREYRGSPGVSGISLHATIRCSAVWPALHPNPAVGGPVVGGTCCVLVCVGPDWLLLSYSRDSQQAVGEGPVAVLCSLH